MDVWYNKNNVYSIHRGKMEQILLSYGLPKETVIIIMMFFRNTEVKVC